MMRSLYALPLAALLAAGYPTLSLADETADQCRKMAADEEVAPEDMEDYISECLAVVQSESPDEGAAAMERLDAVAAGAAPAAQPPAPPAPTSAPKP
ncbi:hypothetical protein [Candidatus Thiodictyon syntrophicum]|jgi:hypothetical protein|uniref:Uncharacterized protein n=1 Tax=Candidatus Thiodictyon syntrophicum TaxID=1166950 RepID=A0A2K8U322_9GAMM|nr:hypothetical protein [Candidatus Thiodictyon syntrophicum]AUB79982.1 hypothetical protein THSYN_02715 [Candidatus Thiodictyon syntrophicum]